MKYTLGLKKLPFEPDCNQIIYIEGKHDEEVNELIRRNFHAIRKCFATKNFDFCYIPFLKHDLTSGERLHYNAPYAKCSREADFMVNDNFILDYMLRPENKEKIPPSLLYFHPYCRAFRSYKAENNFRGIQISASSFKGNRNLSHVLDEILNDIYQQTHSQIEFHIDLGPSNISDGGKEKHDDVSDLKIDECDFNADECFDYESKILVQEIEERIEKLLQKGVESYLIESLFKKRERKLSRLRITEDYRIFLPDYFGMEITMTPLPKAVFLLFLKHPEGIIFSFLPDFRNELMELYKKVKGPFFNEESAQKSIEDVTDPLSNSTNEKCSRIREAFVSHFDDHLARYYYVDGRRGEAKKIALPRSLVEWE